MSISYSLVIRETPALLAVWHRPPVDAALGMRSNRCPRTAERACWRCPFTGEAGAAVRAVLERTASYRLARGLADAPAASF